ncbi:MAG: hypothetical protein GY794_20565 [bacterium]|nr:hypothetical protein [bacterium]
MIGEEMEIDLADVPEIRKLDASFGLSELPKQTALNRSGLYILALRPVEYTSHPVASYPTSINSTRSVEDGLIIEATAITLIPYPDQGSRVELDQRRKQVVREVFLDGSKKGQPTGVLPLAMVALNLGVIQWLDVFMVRREVGALDHDVFGLGLSPRALKESYLRQYHAQLSAVLEQSPGTNRLTAAEHFAALPPAGPMPAASINMDDFTQSFFPAEMDVDLSIIAEDELPALIEDSYSLPAFDLTLNSEEFESSSVLIVIPTSRSSLRQLSLTLTSLARSLSAAAPGLVAKRKPISALRNLSLRRFMPPVSSVSAQENTWREVLQGVETLWFIRRRNISYKEQVVASPLMLARDEAVIEANVTNRFKDLQLTTLVTNIKRRGTTSAEAEIMKLFSSPVMLDGSKIAVKAAVNEITGLETVDRASILKISKRYSGSNFGEGMARLETADSSLSENKRKLDIVAGSGKLPELDLIAKSLAPREFEKFSEELSETATGASASSDKVADLIDSKLKSMDSSSLTLASRKQRESALLITGGRRETRVI